MKRTNILATLLVGFLLISGGCGTSDSLKSITIGSAGTTGSVFNLKGADGTLQLTVTANYLSGKAVDVTNFSTYTVTTVGVDENTQQPLPPYGPTTVPISTTGLMTAVASQCTWVDLPLSAPSKPPQWAYTGYYQVVANYRGLVSQPIAIGVGSATDNQSPVGGCGP